MTPKDILEQFIGGDWESIEDYAKVKFPRTSQKRRERISAALISAIGYAVTEMNLKKEVRDLDPTRDPK